MSRMWQIYSIAWIIYGLLIAVMLQFDSISNGQFNFSKAFSTFGGSLITPLILSFIWPLTGYFERTKPSTIKILNIHFVAALAFALFITLWTFILYHKPDQESPSLAMLIWPFLYFMMEYALMAGVFHGIRANMASRAQALAIIEAQNLLKTAELTALRNKLNPHFLFNTLHSIIALVRKDTVAAESALFHFSDMLRYILDTEKSGTDHVMLDDELDFIRNYLDLEALRLGPRLNIEWDLDSKAGGISVPALSIQPLVENSITHAFNPRSQPGKLLIHCRLNAIQKRLEVVISDDGPGANLTDIAIATGMGIRTVERRLRLEYGAQADFKIITAPGEGFSVSFSIPLLSQ